MSPRAVRRASLPLVLVLALAVAGPGAYGCRPRASERPLTKITIAATSLPASASVYVAEAKGYFRDEGLDATVDRYPSGKLALDAVLHGKADFATVAETPIARAVLDGDDPVVVATIAEIDSANVIVARGDRGIAEAGDLRGKRVGVLLGTSAHFFLHVYLVTSGVDPDDVTVVPLKPEQLVPSVASGTVDAIAVFAPYDIEAQDVLGAGAVVLEQPDIYTTTWNVCLRRGDAEEERESVMSFLRALRRANTFMGENDEEAQRIAARGTGIPVGRLRRLWDGNRWVVRLDQTLILSLEDEARWMSGREGGSPPDFLDYIDPRPLREVSPEDVDIVQPGE